MLFRSTNVMSEKIDVYSMFILLEKFSFFESLLSSITVGKYRQTSCLSKNLIIDLLLDNNVYCSKPVSFFDDTECGFATREGFVTRRLTDALIVECFHENVFNDGIDIILDFGYTIFSTTEWEQKQ